MIFNSLLESQDGVENTPEDNILGTGAATDEEIAAEVERNMQESALSNLGFFEGGEEAVNEFCQSDEAQALLEARKMAKRTFVRLGKNDDLQRRTNMGCLILAREANDPLFKKLALNRVQERKLRNVLFKKYGKKAQRIAIISQKKHIKDMKTMKALPVIKFN